MENIVLAVVAVVAIGATFRWMFRADLVNLRRVEQRRAAWKAAGNVGEPPLNCITKRRRQPCRTGCRPPR